jgi:dUTP pyrophosphatase
MLNINIINKSRHSLPEYVTINAAGLDLKANVDKPILLKPFDRVLIPTGLFIELPVGFHAEIRPRSGFAIKHGITVLNSPGTIDSDYRGEIKIILINLSNIEFVINDGERVCQMVISKHETIIWNPVNILNHTSRGEGGFGHTGI